MFVIWNCMKMSVKTNFVLHQKCNLWHLWHSQIAQCVLSSWFICLIIITDPVFRMVSKMITCWIQLGSLLDKRCHWTQWGAWVVRAWRHDMTLCRHSDFSKFSCVFFQCSGGQGNDPFVLSKVFFVKINSCSQLHNGRVYSYVENSFHLYQLLSTPILQF